MLSKSLSKATYLRKGLLHVRMFPLGTKVKEDLLQAENYGRGSEGLN